MSANLCYGCRDASIIYADHGVGCPLYWELKTRSVAIERLRALASEARSLGIDHRVADAVDEIVSDMEPTENRLHS